MERLRFRTLGEILYEVMTGLLFYPRTLWRVLLWPTEALIPPLAGRNGTGRDEAVNAPPDLVSPPLFLLSRSAWPTPWTCRCAANWAKRPRRLALGRCCSAPWPSACSRW